jgi:hypothetical protein
MLKRVGIWVLVLGLSFVFLAGCVQWQYRKVVPGYEAKIERLKALGGDRKAPYETAKSEFYFEAMKKEIGEGDRKGAEVFREKLDQYLEQGMAKIP